MGSSYHQFCPVAKAMELLDQRWTMLIIRELLLGSRHFNDIRRGVPKMSPSLLSKRLHDLTRAGIVERRNDGHEVEYTLTAAGKELQTVVESLGAWGMRWIGRIGDEDLDPKLLMWDLHRHVDAALVPPGRTVVSFRFNDVPAKIGNWSLVSTSEEVDVCDFDPGYDVAVSVTGTLRRMVEIWRGDLGWSAALRSGSIQLGRPRAVTPGRPEVVPAVAVCPGASLAGRYHCTMTDGRFADCRSSRMGDVTGWRMFASDEGGESGGRLQSAIGLCISFS
jgi:DNA-binding HxlR family transcriptional regulator